MQTSHIFLIESDSAGHRLRLDGQDRGTFATLEAAEEAGDRIARHFAPAAELTFQLDFKWTLSDLEIRAATLDYPANKAQG
jgi:hypothetical protein